MPRFYRQRRGLLRLSLSLVILAGLWGWRYATANWQPDLASLDLALLSAETDWIALVATLLESSLQLFLSLTSGG